MFSYVIGLVAVLFIFYNPILDLLSGNTPQSHRRLPRPEIKEDFLAIGELSNNGSALACEPDSYSVRIFSKDPIVLYVENFLSASERSHLLEISEPIFEPSTITGDGDSTHRNSAVRDSEVALIPRTDVVRCIEARARAFQGWRDELWIERLRVQRYHPGGHYSHHYDWSTGRGGWGRMSSFMIWVDDDEGRLEGGGTEFPLLERRSSHEWWCKFIECAKSDGDAAKGDGNQAVADGAPGDELGGTIFKPSAGNAVFWENFPPDGGSGRGHPASWHAGLPVVKGVKVGLNIWSWGRLD